MARKRHSDEDILKLLREIELHLVWGQDHIVDPSVKGDGDVV